MLPAGLIDAPFQKQTIALVALVMLLSCVICTPLPPQVEARTAMRQQPLAARLQAGSARNPAKASTGASGSSGPGGSGIKRAREGGSSQSQAGSILTHAPGAATGASGSSGAGGSGMKRPREGGSLQSQGRGAQAHGSAGSSGGGGKGRGGYNHKKKPQQLLMDNFVSRKASKGIQAPKRQSR
jgi:hypothetical protein